MSLPSVTDITSELIKIPSVSDQGNVEITDWIHDFLLRQDFVVERLEYINPDDGKLKANLVARKGEGSGGLGFFSHTDTVPGLEEEWQAFIPEVKDGKLYGRGSCDMKGPLAASVLAASSIDVFALKKPVYIVLTADEERGFYGAKHVISESGFLSENWPDMGVVPEPTNLIPVYSHKGAYWHSITAHGVAAHTSTDKGISSNFLIAPFLAEMAELKRQFLSEKTFMNDEFDPPTNGFNLTITDYGCALNATAAKTTCCVHFRSMPNVDNKAISEIILKRAEEYGFEVQTVANDPFFSSPESEIIKLSLEATNETKAVTVPYGTEALFYGTKLPLVILGPGSIDQAHTVGEWIDISQLERSVNVYEKMIKRHCT
ncbi:MAG TPA: M20/M25/M40 family metallo-hydrolase [Oligoflexia bacterium]|nr:M20/M25/M40 family metallo-hydrolase [Oligoflexia bacterium]HMP49770.1 M20/M25/M40 family metallo-hydrolase [Oligoflexia bacterium]